MECAVCLEQCSHPAQLPCGHIFCFLCIKGFATQTKRCAMCRQEVPRDFIDHPKLLENPVVEKNLDEDGYYWFYEGRNGKRKKPFDLLQQLIHFFRLVAV